MLAMPLQKGKVGSEAGRHTEGQADKKTDNQTDRQADRPIDRQIDRLTAGR